jgi:4-hydroxy-tetrahydrodipicolinate synthase
LKVKFEGILPPHITPFTATETIDQQALRRDVDFWIESGVHGLVTCGSNGEGVYMTREERGRVLRLVLDQANGRVPVIAGTGCPSTSQSIALTKDAYDLGVDAALIVTPYYYRLSQEAIYRHFETIANAVDIPLIVYNVPKFTGVNLEPWVLERLLQSDAVIGVKDSSANMRQMQELIRVAGDRVSILAGYGNMIYPTLASGGHGAIVAIANVVPELTVKLYDLFKADDHRNASEVQSAIVVLNDFVTQRHGIPAVKAALNIRGEGGGYPRKPLTPLLPEATNQLRALLKPLVRRVY